MSRIERRQGLLALAALFLLFSAAPPATAGPAQRSSLPDAPPLAAHRPDELVVRFRHNAKASERANARARVGGRVLRDLGFIDAEHLKIKGVSVADAVERLRRHPHVEYAEPNYEWTAFLEPNDPSFPEMYNLRNTGQTGGTPGADIRATQAWDLFTGDPEIKIGVIDTGVDYNHEDLAANIWANPGETPGNGIDDDHNGYVDDVHGYDFANNDSDPFDDHGHGTHVSGTIAAIGDNGVGVVGVNWRAKIVCIKFLGAGGGGSTAAAIASVGYAIAAGVRLTNNSWGGGSFSQGLLDAINAAGAAGQLFVAAAGNASNDNDAFPVYPASYDAPCIVAVASTDHNDQLSGFSNYGATSVDLGAPGSNILSARLGGGYFTASGTSMASPHVAGALGFVLGRFPSMSAADAKIQIMTKADPLPSLAGRVASGGRLNLFASVLEADSIPPAAITDLAAANPASNSIGLTWTATGDDGNTGRAVRYQLRYSQEPITEANFASMPPAPAPVPRPAGSFESAEVRGLAFNTTYYFAIKALDEFGQAGPISNLASATTLGIPDVSWSPPSFSQTLLTGATATQSLTIRNDGQGTLDFTVTAPAAGSGGGPDAFGYRWIDSEQPDGPAFQWVDISGVGQTVPLFGNDVLSAPIPLRMVFPFYGTAFESVYVCTNGFLSFSPGGAPPNNLSLPNVGAPRNLVAPFWDDLYLIGETARTHFDGSRFIVTWENAYHLPTGYLCTFQALLYPNGEIYYQYLRMPPAGASATVGIQNADRSIGLTVAHNTGFVHDQMAVRIHRQPPWLSVSPRTGRVHAGEEAQLTLSFDALGYVGGTYQQDVRLSSNDPDEPQVSVPVQLQVIGAPDLSVFPTALDFGTVFSGSVTTLGLTLWNPGTENLVVSGITSGDPDVHVGPAGFTLAPFGSRLVLVAYAPASPATLNSALTIASNDPDEPTLVVPLAGAAVPAPEVSVTPGSLSATLTIPDSTSQTLTIHNTGGSPLVWSVAVQGAPADSDSVAVDWVRPTVWGSDPRFTTPVGSAIPVDASPLAFLPVVITDPVGDGGVVDVHVLRGGGSGGSLQVQLDLATPIVPTDFGGFLSLDVDRNPDTGLPPSFGAPGQDIGVEYEVLLFSLPSGTVQLYERSGAFLGSFPVTVGAQTLRFAIPLAYLEGDDGDMDVTGVVGNAFGPTDWFPDFGHGTIRSASWLSAAPAEGVVEAGQTAAVTVTWRTAGIVGGDYAAQLIVTTNDPDEREIDVPVQLTAIGVPDLAVIPASLDFGGLFVGLSRDLPLWLRNDGSDTVHVASGSVSGSDFALVGGSFPITLAPEDSAALTIRFAPAIPCDPCPGALTLVSNDPDESPLVVPLVGAGLVPPDIALSPESFSASLFTGQTTTRTLHIENSGGSPLTWSIRSRGSGESSSDSAAAGGATPTSWEVLGPAPASAGVNRANVPDGAQAVRATYGVPGQGPRILLYADDYTSAPGYMASDLALQSLGLAYTAHYYDANGFGNALTTQSWDLVVVEHASFYELGRWWSEIEAFVRGGGKVLISTFDVDGSNSEPTTLWSTIGLIPRGDHDTPPPVYWWDPGHSIFNYPYVVPPLLDRFDAYYDNGDRVAALGGARDPAGFTPARTVDRSAIVISTSQRAIVNSFVAAEYKLVAAPPGGLPNVAKLLANEIDYLAGSVAWLSSDPAEGSVPAGGSADVQIIFDATGLQGGDYFADLLVSSNDPDEPELSVPAHLHVTGTPDIAVDRPPRMVESSAKFVGSGAQTRHDLVTTGPPAGDGVFELVAEGMFNNPGQTATLLAEGHTIGQVSTFFPGCVVARGEFTVAAATLASLAADGVVRAVVVNSAAVGDLCPVDRHTVRLRYPLPANSIDFGGVFEGTCVRDSFRVLNQGTDTLRVTSIVASHPAFAVSPTAFQLKVGASRMVVVTYCPPAAGLHEGAITVHSDDLDEPAVGVSVRGRGLVPPDIAASPPYIVSNLSIPGAEVRTVTVRNTGGSDLAFAVESTSDSGAAYELPAPSPDLPDPAGAMGIGGPDAFGYHWIDSDHAGGPTFAWVDIAHPENRLNLSGQDAMSDSIPLGMSFPFYGNSFSAIRVTTNGFLTFSSCCPVPTNARLPSSAAPANLIAPFWDGLILPPSIYAKNDGERFIVTWKDGIHRGTAGGPYTFQAILYPNGIIVYQYQRMTPTVSQATVGIQNAGRNVGLTVVHNAAYIHNSLAIMLTPPLPIMSVQPTSGVVPPGGSLDLTVELRTFGLLPGVYRDTVAIASNDPDERTVSVPVTLNAGMPPDIAATPASVDFGTVFIGGTLDRTVEIRNAGLGTLDVTSASVTGAGFSLAPGAAALPAPVGPGQSLSLAVRFAPSSVCTPCTGALVVSSNDADENPLTVPLAGTGLPPPDISASLDTLKAAGATTLGPTALRRTKPLVVSNTGGSDLLFLVPVPRGDAEPGVLAGASWISANPPSGTIPPGGSMTLQVVFDATGLSDGDHAGHLLIVSNDPDEPALEVPMRFHVGAATATLEVEPGSLNPQAEGRWIAADLELGQGLDPHEIALATVLLQRSIGLAADGPISYGDDDEDGLPEVRYRFDRESLLDLLAVGNLVPVEAIGEVEDVTWFRGVDMVRVLHVPGRAAAEAVQTERQVPAEFGLQLAGPSPARGSAGLELAIPIRSEVDLSIFDTQGRRVAEVARRGFDPGRHRLEWNGRDRAGAPAPAGVYFARMVAGGRAYRVRVALLR